MVLCGIAYRTHADRLYDDDDDNGPMRNSSLFSVSPGAHLGLGCARQIERRVLEWNGKHGYCVVLCYIVWYCAVLRGGWWLSVKHRLLPLLPSAHTPLTILQKFTGNADR